MMVLTPLKRQATRRPLPPPLHSIMLSTNVNKQREDCLNTARVEPDGYMRAITLCLKGIDRVGDENANA
jgi:hypothetical protein